MSTHITNQTSSPQNIVLSQPSVEAEKLENTLNSIYEDSLNGIDQKLKNIEGNIGYAVCLLQQKIEAASDKKIEAGLKETKEIQNRMSDVSQLLNYIENGLANPQAKTLHLGEHSVLIEKIHSFIPHDLFKKTEFTKEEAEVIAKVLHRHSEQAMRDLNQKFIVLNRYQEQGHEFLTLFKDLLKTYREYIHAIIYRQKV